MTDEKYYTSVQENNNFNSKKMPTTLEDNNISSGISNNYDDLRLSKKKPENVYDVITAGTDAVGNKSQKSKRDRLYECLDTKNEQNPANLYDTLHRTTSSNRSKIVQRGNKRLGLSLLFGCLGSIIGAVAGSLIVFFVMKLNLPTNDDRPSASEINNSTCIWSTWSQWFGCDLPCVNGREQRIKQHISVTGICNPSTDVETRSCFKMNCFDSGEEFDMKFDPSTLHSKSYLSNNNTVLSNQPTNKTPPTSDSNNRLKNYNGVIADRCFDQKMKIYYEVAYEYTIQDLLRFTNLVLEVGLAQPDQIDNFAFVGNEPKGWSFAIARCGQSTFPGYVCLRAKHNDKLDINSIIHENQDYEIKKNGTFTILIDRVKNEFSLQMDFFHNSIISFQNVSSDDQLCPVFGVYNPDKVDVKLRLVKTRNLTSSIF